MDRPIYPKRLPVEQWPAAVFRSPDGWDHPFKPPKQPQGTQNQCICSVVAWCVEWQRAAQGMLRVDLSAADLFGAVPTDQTGTKIGYVLDQAEQKGIGLTKVSGEVFTTGMVPSPDEYRACFKSTWFDGNFDFGLAFSAIAENKAVACGVMWKAGFKYLDTDGWLKTAGMAGEPYGHELAAYGLATRYVNGQIEYGLKVWNPIGSFSAATGSCCVIPQSKFVADASDFWICDSVTQI